MTDRDYLWCALNLLLDGQEELDQLCPACRAEAERKTCPVCGVPLDQCGHNDRFDWERFETLKGAGA